MFDNSNVKKEINDKLNYCISLIKKQYLFDDKNIPWLVGYSGGKDSTVTAQLVFRALLELKKSHKPLRRKVYIFSSDTMIENPLVKEIIEENINLINQSAVASNLPLEALILKPDISKTFWVNIIGRGYPTPNTMFRWCTDRLKIEPANNFVHKCIDKNGEVIMVLGVREGESNTRDRVLEKHSIEGQQLMKHTTLNNAYVFPPIKTLDVMDVFTYLGAYESPWGSNNKKLVFFYEESGAGDCPIFVSEEDKKSGNSCGNSRLGCWVCTVVSKDKSLSGFIQTGFYDFLIPLLKFRNWITSIRDDDEYRCHYRNNGSIYTKKAIIKEDKNGKYISIPKKGARDKIDIRLDKNLNPISEEYYVVELDKLSLYMRQNNLTFKSPELSKILLKDRITSELFRLGTGPFTDGAKKEIFKKLIKTEAELNHKVKMPLTLITDLEIVEIKKLWDKQGMDTSFIDTVLSENGRKSVEIYRDAFEEINIKYRSKLNSILKKHGLDYEIVNKLVQSEKELVLKENRKEIQDVISSVFNADKSNY